MVNKEEKYDLIDRYIRGELRGKELTSFQALLNSDPNFAGEVDLHCQVAEAIADVKSRELERVIEEVGREFDREGRNVRVRRFLLVAATVAGILLAAVTSIYVLYSNSATPQTLVASNFEPYELYSQLRSESAEPSANEGFEAYGSNDFKGAIAYFEAARSAGKGSPEITFFLANAYMANQQHAEALPLLRSLNQSSGHLLNEQADWYLALCLLSVNSVDEARQLLNNMQQTGHAYAAQAAALSTELSEL